MTLQAAANTATAPQHWCVRECDDRSYAIAAAVLRQIANNTLCHFLNGPVIVQSGRSNTQGYSVVLCLLDISAHGEAPRGRRLTMALGGKLRLSPTRTLCAGREPS